MHADAHALRAERPRDLRADTPPGAGDQGSLTAELDAAKLAHAH